MLRNLPKTSCFFFVAASFSVWSAQVAFADESLPDWKPAISHPHAVNANQSINLRRSITNSNSSLEIATSNALQQSFELRAALLDDEAAKTDILQSYARFLPKINGTAHHHWNRGSVKTATVQTSGKSREVALGVNFSVPLIAGGRNIFGLKQSRSARNATKASVVATRFKVELEVAQSYYAVARDRTIENRLKEAVSSLGKISRVTTARFRAGEASRTDIALANSAVRAMQADYASAQGQRLNSEVVFRSLTNAKPARMARFYQSNKPLPYSLAIAKDMMVKNNPRLRAAFHQVDADQYQTGVVRAASLPQLSLVGGYTRERIYGLRRNREREWQIGLNLSVPLVDVENLARYKASKARASARYYRALDLRRQLVAQLEADWNSYNAAKNQRIAFKRQVVSLSSAIVGVSKEYRAGLRSITDVLNARINKVRAEVQLAHSKHGERVTQLRILSSIGLSGQDRTKVARR